MRRILPLISLVIALSVLVACSNTRYLPEGELLYTGGKVKVKDSLITRRERKALEAELTNTPVNQCDFSRKVIRKRFASIRIRCYAIVSKDPLPGKGRLAAGSKDCTYQRIAGPANSKL